MTTPHMDLDLELYLQALRNEIPTAIVKVERRAEQLGAWVTFSNKFAVSIMEDIAEPGTFELAVLHYGVIDSDAKTGGIYRGLDSTECVSHAFRVSRYEPRPPGPPQPSIGERLAQIHRDLAVHRKEWERNNKRPLF